MCSSGTSLFWSATLPTFASASADPTTLRRAPRFEVSIGPSGSALGPRTLGTRRTSLALAASPHWRARQVVPVCVICLRLRVV
jgi:hypothetical protein